jgi:hypothetical protein
MLIEQRPHVTNLNVSVADLMDMPLERISYFAEKLDEQRSADVAARKAKPPGS